MRNVQQYHKVFTLSRVSVPYNSDLLMNILFVASFCSLFDFSTLHLFIGWDHFPNKVFPLESLFQAQILEECKLRHLYLLIIIITMQN